jgi:hypothetical protein
MQSAGLTADSETLFLVFASLGFLLATSGLVVELALSYIDEDVDNDGMDGDGDPRSSEITAVDRDIGVIIGKCENVLVLAFVLLGAYTGLAIIFAAKGIVRRDDILKNTRYYLAGTLVNFTYSVALAVSIRGVTAIPPRSFTVAGVGIRTSLGAVLVATGCLVLLFRVATD